MNIMRCSVIHSFLFTLLIAVAGCTYDKKSEVYPDPPVCDTAGTISYALQIKPIMAAHCNTCHGTASPQAGVTTQTHEGLSTIALNSALWQAVNWTGPVKMPQDGEKLSACDLAKIKKWVDQGAPDN